MGKSAVEPLIAALKDGNAFSRKLAANALVELKDPRSEQPLLTALKNKDLDVVTGAYSFFIAVGEPGSEEILINALNKLGNSDMATDFLNCGNNMLAEAATKWAEENGYRIIQGGGGRGPIWGSQ